MSADLGILVQDQITGQALLFFVGRQTCIGNDVIPAKPQLSIPVALSDTGHLLKINLAGGLASVLCCKALDFAEDAFFHRTIVKLDGRFIISYSAWRPAGLRSCGIGSPCPAILATPAHRHPRGL